MEKDKIVTKEAKLEGKDKADKTSYLVSKILRQKKIAKLFYFCF